MKYETWEKENLSLFLLLKKLTDDLKITVKQNTAIITTLSDGNELITTANQKRELEINRCYVQSLLYVRIDSIKISLM